MIELEERYKEERDQRQEMLMLGNDRFDKLKFIKVADERINVLESLQLSNEGLEVEVEKVIKSIQLPSEMIWDAIDNSVELDEEASIAFLSLYRDKVTDLMSIYDGILWDYREEIESYEVNPPVQKSEIMMLSRKSFSEELQNIIETMRDNSIRLCMNTNTGKISACYYASALHDKLGFITFHNYMNGYVNMMAHEPYLVDLGAEDAFEKAVNHLRDMEYTLVNVQKDTNLYPVLETYFVTLLHNIIKGSVASEIFDGQGIVKDDYKLAWVRIIFSDEATPLSYLVRPIVDEMEKSDWCSSESWEQFSRDKIVEALELARNGELEEMMYGKMPIVETI